jgi:hypothetical protein
MVKGSAASGATTEAALCSQTLTDILTSKCFSKGIVTPCICGMTSTTECLNGAQPPMGPVYQDYVSDFGSDINGIVANMWLAKFGTGVADNIVDCLSQLGCSCFGN